MAITQEHKRLTGIETAIDLNFNRWFPNALELVWDNKVRFGLIRLNYLELHSNENPSLCNAVNFAPPLPSEQQALASLKIYVEHLWNKLDQSTQLQITEIFEVLPNFDKDKNERPIHIHAERSRQE